MMRFSAAAALAFVLSCPAAGRCAEPRSHGAALPPRARHDNAAVVELYTSLACRPCSDVASNFRDMVDDARASDRRVFGLTFHVDYLNSQDVRDHYSDPVFSDRQRAYGRFYKRTRIGVPQAIVNGVRSFAGSNQAGIDTSVKDALRHPSRLQVELTEERATNRESVRVHYRVAGFPKARHPFAFLHVAVVEKEGEETVTYSDGSTSGFIHTNVVRSFESVRLEGNGDGSLDLLLPVPLRRGDVAVVAFVQDAKTYAVMGADSIDFTDSAAGAQ